MVKTTGKTVWLSNLPEFSRQLQTTEAQIVREVTDIAFGSIVNGSLLTGSPGQPDDLRDGDWVESFPSQTSGKISTSEPSARSVEDGISYKFGTPLTKLKSEIGGFHSLALTHQNADKIIGAVIQRVRRA